MKIGFIARGLTKGGVTRYIKNIFKTFDADFSMRNSLIVFTDNDDFKTVYKNIQVIYVKKSGKLFWDYIKILPYLFTTKLDVVFYPKNIIPFTHVVFKFKKINIIHDLAYFDKTLNEYKLHDTLYMRTFLKLSCLISDAIIADSYSTKSDLEAILNITSDKINVVHLAVDECFKKQIDKGLANQNILKLSVRKPFIFYCGSLSPRKNILKILVAYNEIKDQIPHNIYLAGGQSWHDKDVKEYISHNLSDRVFVIGNVSDEELVSLYLTADIYLYPSLCEGFGLPILEAQACGCPVLTSDRSSCPEVAGYGALIINPDSVEEIKKGILKIISNDAFRKEIIQKGYINVQKYSWDKTVDDLLKCAQSLKNEQHK